MTHDQNLPLKKSIWDSLPPESLAPRRFEPFLRSFSRFYFRWVHGTRFDGVENIPTAPFIMAANHQSYYDPPLVGLGHDHRIKFMAWDELFCGGLFERFIRDWGAFPLDPSGGDSSGYRDALDFLKRGQSVGIFPEGERSYDGKLLPFREGVARLAMKANVPIVPVCLWGANRAWPRGDAGPRPFFKIQVAYLPPLYPKPAPTPTERRIEAKRLTEAIVQAIRLQTEKYETEG